MTTDDGTYFSYLDIPVNVRRAVTFHGKESDGLDRMDYDSYYPGYSWPRMNLNASGTTIFTNRAIAGTHGAIGGTPGYTPPGNHAVDYSYVETAVSQLKLMTICDRS